MVELKHIEKKKYKVIKRIGQGGMGSVYECENVKLGKRFAIKILRTSLSDDESMKARFWQEARIAAKIEHENICEVIDIGELDDGTPYMVMPLLIGESLDKEAPLLNDDFRETGMPHYKPLGMERVLSIADQILNALEVAHLYGAVHRDLKPENIFVVKSRTKPDLVKVLDFGLAKTIGGDTTGVYTQSGTVLGTFQYMALEQLNCDKKIDHRADIYSVGVLLYRLLTGIYPYWINSCQARSWISTLENGPLTEPRNLNREISSELNEIILKSLRLNCRERYRSATDLRLALKDVSIQRAERIQIVEDTGAQLNRKFSPIADTLPADGKITPSEVKNWWRFTSIASLSIIGIFVFVIIFFFLKGFSFSRYTAIKSVRSMPVTSMSSGVERFFSRLEIETRIRMILFIKRTFQGTQKREKRQDNSARVINQTTRSKSWVKHNDCDSNDNDKECARKVCINQLSKISPSGPSVDETVECVNGIVNKPGNFYCFVKAKNENEINECLKDF